MKTEPTLAEVRTEINKLQREKQRKMALANSLQERNQLLREINQLEVVKRNPNMAKSFGRSFGKGLKTIGKSLWSGIRSASKNLDTNAPEFKQFGKSMTSRPMDMYMPKAEPNLKKVKVMKKVKKNKVRRAIQEMPFNLP